MCFLGNNKFTPQEYLLSPGNGLCPSSFPGMGPLGRISPFPGNGLPLWRPGSYPHNRYWSEECEAFPSNGGFSRNENRL